MKLQLLVAGAVATGLFVFTVTHTGGSGVIHTMRTMILTIIPTITRDHITDTTRTTAIQTTERVITALTAQKQYKPSSPAGAIIEVRSTECLVRRAGTRF